MEKRHLWGTEMPMNKKYLTTKELIKYFMMFLIMTYVSKYCKLNYKKEEVKFIPSSPFTPVIKLPPLITIDILELLLILSYLLQFHYITKIQ